MQSTKSWQTLSVLALLALAGCEPKQREETSKADTPLSIPGDPAMVSVPEEEVAVPTKPAQFPLRRTLHNSLGKSLEGEVVAKEGGNIAFRRDLDGMVFPIPIAQLSADDQLILERLEDEGRVADAQALGGDEPAKPAQFPLRRTLHNSLGKSLEGEVVAKRGEYIAFRRDSDGKTFPISVSQLSVDDQLILGSMEDEGQQMMESLDLETGSQGSSSSGMNEGTPNRPLLAREIQWKENLESALAASEQSGRPILVVITGDFHYMPDGMYTVQYSESAHRISDSLIRTVLRDTSFLGFVNDTFEAVHFSHFLGKKFPDETNDQMIEMFTKWKVVVLPATIILDSEGKEITRIDGYDRRGPNLLREKLKAKLKN